MLDELSSSGPHERNFSDELLAIFPETNPYKASLASPDPFIEPDEGVEPPEEATDSTEPAPRTTNAVIEAKKALTALKKSDLPDEEIPESRIKKR